MTYSDEFFMQRAIDEAMEAMDADEVPIGAVIVLGNEIIGRGHNLTQTLNDVTAHAEMQAITAAANHLGAKYLNDCTLYVTLEPCIMCAGAIAWAQLGRLVYAANDPKKGFTTIGKPILHPKTEIVTGILAEESSDILRQFFQSKRR